MLCFAHIFAFYFAPRSSLYYPHHNSPYLPCATPQFNIASPISSKTIQNERGFRRRAVQRIAGIYLILRTSRTLTLAQSDTHTPPTECWPQNVLMLILQNERDFYHFRHTQLNRLVVYFCVRVRPLPVCVETCVCLCFLPPVASEEA